MGPDASGSMRFVCPAYSGGGTSPALLQAQGDDGTVVLNGAVVLEAFEDLFSDGMELRHVEGGELLGEKVVEDLGALS